MEMFNHDSNGAKGLRLAASVCVVLGWIGFVVCVILSCMSYNWFNMLLILRGLGCLAVMYLTAFSCRAMATMAEAAQLYRDRAAAEDREEAE